MKTSSMIFLLLAMLASYGMISPASALGPPGSGLNDESQASITQTCLESTADDEDEDDVAGTISFSGQTKLWPPNHKPSDPVVITITDEDADDDVTLTVTDGHNEEGLTGSGKPGGDDVDNLEDDPDTGNVHMETQEGSASTSYSVVVERSGKGDDAGTFGRVYRFDVTAMFSDSDMDESSEMSTTCTTTYHVCVPHDMRKSRRQDACPNPEDGSEIQGTAPAGAQGLLPG